MFVPMSALARMTLLLANPVHQYGSSGFLNVRGSASRTHSNYWWNLEHGTSLSMAVQ